MYIIFDKVDTPFSHGRGLTFCSSLYEFSKTKESTLHVIWNLDCIFFFFFDLWGRNMVLWQMSGFNIDITITIYIDLNEILLKLKLLLKFHSPEHITGMTSIFSGWYCPDLLLVMLTEHSVSDDVTNFHYVTLIVGCQEVVPDRVNLETLVSVQFWC